jgi:hypothetical protein
MSRGKHQYAEVLLWYPFSLPAPGLLSYTRKPAEKSVNEVQQPVVVLSAVFAHPSKILEQNGQQEGKDESAAESGAHNEAALGA